MDDVTGKIKMFDFHLTLTAFMEEGVDEEVEHRHTRTDARAFPNFFEVWKVVRSFSRTRKEHKLALRNRVEPKQT